MLTKTSYDVAIVGGGFFGMSIAEHFALRGKSVLLCERGSAFMTRASYVNQARVHNGYHYPRSILTAMRSHMSFPRFVEDFSECIYKSFDQYYCVAKILSKVNAAQYQEFCTRVGDICEVASPKVKKLFNSKYIEEVFRTREYAFDAKKLCSIMETRVNKARVDVSLSTEVTRMRDCKPYDFTLDLVVAGEAVQVHSSIVFNCTYANINQLNNASGISLVPLKYEMTEMALVDVPDEVNGSGFTVMCGPFFSVMPFPAESTYSLSHVRYTPHYEWHDVDGQQYVSPLEVCMHDKKQTAYQEMVHDAARYLPCMERCKYQKSIWDIKTVLPSSEVDDSRPILFKMDYAFPGYNCVMGGKIDNIYDVIDVIDANQEKFKL